MPPSESLSDGESEPGRPREQVAPVAASGRSTADIETVGQSDPPLLAEILAYWERKCAGRWAPRRADIDPTELPAHLPNLMLIDVLEGGADFRFRLIGTAIVEDMGRDSTGRRMSELYRDHPAALAQLADRLRQVVRERRPNVTRGGVYWLPQRSFRSFIRAAMPLSDDGASVTMILVELLLPRS